MKILPIEDLTYNNFHYNGEHFTIEGVDNTGYNIIATSDNGRQKHFSHSTEVIQDFTPIIEKAVKAHQYLEAFEELALHRMIELYKTLDTSEFFRKATKELKLEYDNNEIYAIFLFGYHETGHFESERINAAILAQPYEEWSEYVKLRKNEQDAKEELKKQQRISEKDKRYQEYLKLKQEFNE